MNVSAMMTHRVHDSAEWCWRGVGGGGVEGGAASLSLAQWQSALISCSLIAVIAFECLDSQLDTCIRSECLLTQ